MKKVLIDTNIYSCAMKGDMHSIKILQRAEYILMSPIVIGELLSGFNNGRKEIENREQLKKFLSRERITEIMVSFQTSEFYTKIVSTLKKNGTPIPTNDIWIAASCLENGAAIATMDKHFQQVPGLYIIKPGELP